MKTYLFIFFLSLGLLATVSSCNKHTCPTYATSQPTKGTKKAIKKARAAYDKGNAKKDKKSAKGKSTSGI
ncbi:MAG: hypothetical protein LRY27_01960 [Chitinophagales bacterium]|nr:hypothetical protein [Chitinophagales bacterium]